MSKSKRHRSDRIAERLAERRLLVTGATGLLGKVFVEKLLRSVPQIGRISLLVRGRPDGLSGAQRLEREILGSSVFERLIALLGPKFETLCREKIDVVSGDLTHERLGLSDQDYEALAGRVDIIVNSAAAVTFDERLDVALHLNALGPTRLLRLAHDCGDIPFMQISTCYVSGRRSGEIPEELGGAAGSAALDLDEVIAQMSATCERIAAGGLDDEALHRKFIEAGMELAQRYGWNDTYTFTKWLGEQLLDRDRGQVPLVILRPAIIEGSYAEPVPGWIDGLRMADPMIMAFGRGKLGEFPANPDIALDIIPVDYVANAMIATLPLPDDPPGVRVYQACSSHTNPLRISVLARCLGESFRRRPMTDEAGRPVDAGEFKLVHRDEFLHKWEKKLRRIAKLKALLEMFGVAVERRRKLSALMTQVEQVMYFAKIYAPYTHLDCRFGDHNLRARAESLHADDRAEFPFAVERIDWPDYINNRHIPGLRKYVLGGSTTADLRILRPSAPRADDQAIREAQDETHTIFELFERVARICGEKTALQMCRNGRWVCYSYTEVLAATAAVARRLAELGLAVGDRVAICAENCPEWGVTYLAAMRAGLTAVPLDPQLPAEDVVGCAEFADAKLICAGRSTFEAISAAVRTRVSNEQPAVVQMDESFVPPPGASADEGPPPTQVPPDAMASILFTSGTVVAPKAVPLTHANLLSNARALLEVHPLRSAERFVSVLPMYHVFEFTGGFVLPMIIGATVTYVEQLKGPEILTTTQAARPTIMLTVPRLLKLFHDGIMRVVKDSGIGTRAAFRLCGVLSDLSGGALARKLYGKVHRRFGGALRMFISGGSALDPDLHAGFSRMGFEVYEGYGLTETSPVLTLNPPGRSKAGSTGPALPGLELQIRNANNAGIGELWARGPNVMHGYLNNPQASAEVMRDGWFRTGDLCRCDGDGYYCVTGRVKDMIVTEAGKNVYPDEVEARYKNLPYVKELCVLGLTNPGGIGESVHVVIVPDYAGHAELDRSAIERTIREEASAISAGIPTHQRIQALHFWNTELPRTSSFKAKRSVIRETLKDGGRARPEITAPAASSKQRTRTRSDDGLTRGQLYVRGMLSELTTEPESSIRAESNLLLDLGVDSLMKLQLIGELEAHFDLTCTNETAAALARVSDLFALVGDKTPKRGKARASRSRRQRQHETAIDQAVVADGRMPAPLLPARWMARAGLAMFFRTYVRVRARGVKHLPRTGSFLLAPNHSSHLDAASVVTAIAGRRRVWVAGAEDYFFDTPLKSWVFGRLLDTIPFDRYSEGFEGLRRCREKLDQGDGVLFFPEGTRSLSGRMGEFKIGAALMAVESGARIVPTRIEHAFDLLPKGRRIVRPGVVKVTFGEPIDPDPWKCPDDLNEQYHLYRELSLHLREQVAGLGDGQVLPAENR